jgi:hypothetical protein
MRSIDSTTAQNLHPRRNAATPNHWRKHRRARRRNWPANSYCADGSLVEWWKP